MSYILDALRPGRRRARARWSAVKCPACSRSSTPRSTMMRRPRPCLLIVAVVVLALALAAMLAWNFFAVSEPPRAVVQVPVSVTPPTPLPAPINQRRAVLSIRATRRAPS